MAKKQFKAESKRLLDIMINSVYTEREIFLRELLSNASDALDKHHYSILTDKTSKFKKKDLNIRIVPNQKERTLTISDTGIGMNKEELETNLGVIAKSGSLAFKLENKIKDPNDIIGQFGVGFYAAFMVASKVTVISKKVGTEEAYQWEASGVDGYAVKKATKDEVGTDVILTIKENTDEEKYDDFLEEYHLRWLVKKYSNFIKYPIVMMVTKSKPKKDKEEEMEEYQTDETLNSMIPIWRKKKQDLKAEDYANFYAEQRYGFDKPLKVIHTKAEGVISYDALLFIPSELPFDFYAKEWQKGLALYSSNVLITEKCESLLPDYFGFVKGLVDSPDISLNLSRELLQQDRQVQFIQKRIKDKIKQELLKMMKEEREQYEQFFKNFGRIIKYGVYSEWGRDKDFLVDLLMFYSSKKKQLVTLDEYLKEMKADQKYIYYATGADVNLIDKLPQTEFVKEKDCEILYLTEEIDEFAIKVLQQYKEKEFKSVASDDLSVNEEEVKKLEQEHGDLLKFMGEILKDKVKEVKVSTRLVNHPVCLTSVGEVSMEMEKVLKMMPNQEGVKSEKVLELNPNHELFNLIKDSYKKDQERLKVITNVLYNQSLLIEGFAVDDPVQYAEDVYQLIK